ncbi:PREDICTED: uncharacterized protein LOC106323577 [Brassica oleracea var. oleracea]|uniref:uncharacterized protein LOC106323577 n=1 Tax=Brassica oleracea var. oleracea TaxID=109376 RepID=UPI0006A6FB5C|nr:PREDICTED: uncharacterized protein LOC106323577 [Brassica oleracea var. oleracea]
MVPPSTSWQPRANAAQASLYNPNEWLLDSGATHLLTSDLNNLAIHQAYTGGEEVAIADGSGLSITHTGSTSILTPTITLKLQDILCVPSVNKNLISVYRLCNANQVSVEFFPSCFQVKDLTTGIWLLQGHTKDNGGEFIALRHFLSTHGVSHFTTPPHTPEHNGLSERKHRHVVETGLSLLSSANMPLTHWPFAFPTAVFLINRLPTPILSNISPYQKLFGNSPNYHKLRTFGCLCFPWLRPYAPNKLENRSSPCVFVGYSLTQSAYQCLEPVSGRLHISRHVRFNETQFPFAQLTKPSSFVPNDYVSSPSFTPFTTVPVPQSLIQSPLVSLDNQSSSRDASPTTSQQSSSGNSATAPEPEPAPILSSPTPVSQASEAESPDRDSTAQAAVPEPQQEAPRHSMTTRSRNNIVKPVTRYNLTASLQCDPCWIPSTWQQTIKHEHWRKAMSSEFNSTTENHTWDLVSVAQTMNIVGCRWVFTIKYHPDGSIDKYKARIVAKGFHQQQGIDYNDTFSPVIKATTIRIVLGLAVSNNWPIRQIDVNTAFLQGHLNEEVFMSQPPGFTDSDRPTHVINSLAARFSIKDMGNLSYFLDIETIRTAHGLQLMQRKYITDLVVKANMLHAKPVATPLSTHPKLTLNSGSATSTLHAYSDADWTGNSDDYVSTNGYIIYIGSHPVSWTSKKQRGVARSSTEAEYRAVANTASELRWICSLLTELGIKVPTTPTVYCDNIGATYLCANPVFHSRMKHIAIDFHFVRGQIQTGVSHVVHVSTKDQLADGLTKPLARAPFQLIRNKIGVTQAPPS